MTWLYIAIGGAVGALARYGIGGWVQNRAGFAFPAGTLVVNVLGCMLIGLSLRYLEATRLQPDVRAFVAVGLLGAFTTFSTFSYETVALLEDEAWGRAVAYVVGSVVLGIAAVYVGIGIATFVLRPRV